MNVLFLPFAALARDEATAKLCRQIPRLVGSELERAASAHGLTSRFLSSRGTTESGTPGLVASLELPTASDLETTARMYGADLVMTGRFGLTEHNMLLEGRIYRTSDRSEVFAKRFETYPSYYFDAVEELKVRTVQTLRLELSDRERVELLKRPTESWQALLYYLLAEDDLYALSLGMKPANVLAPLETFREALLIDSDFTLARSGMQHYVILLLQADDINLETVHTILERYSPNLPAEFVNEVSSLF